MKDDEQAGAREVEEPEAEEQEAGVGPGEPPVPRLAELALVGTFVLGVVTSLLVVLTWGMLSGDDESVPAQADLARAGDPLAGDPLAGDPLDGDTQDGLAGGSPGTTPTGSTQRPDEVASRLARCVDAERTVSQALSAVRPALEQWQVHVEAMNQLVVGEITLQQATSFWNRTRVGARHKVHGFRETMADVRSDGVDCVAPDLLAPDEGDLRACARRVGAEVAVLRAARTSIDTWDRHIEDMDMLRLGQLSPEEATRMWLSMWRQGVRDLEAYRAARQRAHQLPGCAGPSGS